jgi:hypothetical protein
MASRIFVVAVMVLVALAPAGAARAQNKGKLKAAEQKMIELNREALSSYEAKDFEAAKQALLDAVVLGKESGLTNDKMMARTYLHLGALYTEGLNDRAKGIRYLGLALRIRPDINLTPSLVTPSLNQAFEDAKTDPTGNTITPVAGPAPKAAPPKPTPAPPKPTPAPTPKPAAPPPPPPPPPPPVAAPEPAPEPPPPEETGNEEPDLPASLPTPLHCPNPDEAPPGEDIFLRCVLRPELTASKVVLFYRLPGGESFTEVITERSPKGWYNGTIPGDAASGKSLQYYFEARDASGKELATNGRNDSPNLMLVREGAPIVGRGALAGTRFQSGGGRGREEEDPLKVQESERAEIRKDLGKGRRRAGTFYAGASIGTGYGWHRESKLEYKNELQVGAGLSSVGAFFVSPEVGYMITDAFSISLLGRFQYIPPEGVATPNSGAPATGANSGLVKLTYGFGRGNFQFLMSLAAGAGEGVRMQIPPKPTPLMPATSLTRNDTVRVGPFIGGPGVGLIYQFHRHFAWILEARGMVGLPDFGIAIDGYTGPQIGF